MGSPPDEPGRYDNEGAQHEVTILRPFWMGVTPVTQEQYQEVTGGNPSVFSNPANPVERVTFFQAREFCRKVSIQSGRCVRLPLEAQWEYACRAGARTAYVWGDNPDEGAGWCNAADQTAKAVFPEFKVFNWSDGYVYTSPVGSFRPNAWGLHDMLGNVWEWCADDYVASCGGPEAAPPRQPPLEGEHRVLRGGSWDNGPRDVRCARRLRGTAAGRSKYVGFRVVVDLGAPETGA